MNCLFAIVFPAEPRGPEGLEEPKIYSRWGTSDPSLHMAQPVQSYAFSTGTDPCRVIFFFATSELPTHAVLRGNGGKGTYELSEETIVR